MADIDENGAVAVVEGSIGPDGVPVIALRGEIDISNVERVGATIDELLRGQSERVVFAADGLTFMDSSAIALLVQIHNRFDSIEFRNPTEIVRRVIDITGLSETFGVTP